MHMKKSRFGLLWGIGAGLFLLSVVPALSGAQGVPPATPQGAPMSLPARPHKLTEPADDFAGLKYTDDQQAKIRHIHQDIKASMDAVIKDKRLSPEQKGAMLRGYQHRERGEVYKVLTAEQQKEVRRRVLARREAAQKEPEKARVSPGQ